MTRAAAEQRLTEPGKDERGTRRSERGTDEQQDLATGEAY